MKGFIALTEMDCPEDLSNCSPCTLRNLTKPSVVFCPVCEESLCDDCKEHHKVSKLSRGHQLLAIDNYCELPPLFQNIKQFCETHGDILEFFCQSHDEVCCKRCATTTHSKCNESVKLLQDLIGSTETCPSFDDIAKSLSDLEVNTNAAIMDRERNMEDLAGQKQTILQDIELRRQKLNEHLDKIEAQVKGQLDTQFGVASTHINKTLKSLRDRHAQVEEITKSTNQIRESHINSVPYFFICKRAIDSTVEKLEKEIKKEYESKAFLRTSLKYRVGKTEVKASDIARPLGEVVTEVDKSPWFTLQRTQPIGAQGSASRKNNVRNVKLSLNDTITLSVKGIITGCTVRKDGSVIVANGLYPGELIKICNKKEVRIHIRDSFVFDIVNVDDKTVAVTTGLGGQRIDIYEGDSLMKVRSITCEPRAFCYGAAVRDKFIIFLASSKLTYTINSACTETGCVSSLVTGISDCYHAYVTSDKNHVYYSNRNDDTVVCFDNNGKECWTFHKPDELKSPRGITIDTNSNLYVAGYKTNNVVMISPDGQSHREILSSNDGLDKPQTICYDKERSQLLVCNAKGPVFLFQVI